MKRSRVCETAKSLTTRWALAIVVVAFPGCELKDAKNRGEFGRMTIDGSSTVYPIVQAAAEEFLSLHPKVEASVGFAGTGGGFKRFVTADLDICDASRPIEPSEQKKCRENGVEYLELKIGTDGISVVVNRKNDWCRCLTVKQLKQLWEPSSKIKRWNQLDASFPDREIVLYGPDTDSGTFDYFTETICGGKGKCRTDYTPSSNDNFLIQGIEGDAGSLGYFGYAYYVLNQQSLKCLKIAADEKSGGVEPSERTILDGSYRPLSRPLFLYVNKKSLERPEVASFLSFFMSKAPELVGEVHYIPLPTNDYAHTAALLTGAARQ